jgi:hypothetical protein
LDVAAVRTALGQSSSPSAAGRTSKRVAAYPGVGVPSISALPPDRPVVGSHDTPPPRGGVTVRKARVPHPGDDPRLATVVVRLLGGGAWSPADLVEIVGSGWRDDAGQSNALAALLRRAVPFRDLVALSEVWETAVASLTRGRGPLTVTGADRLVGEWLALATERADAWRRPRSQRGKPGRRSERPAGDLSRAAS